ncbi:MAG TPA: hypothetical protein VHW23_32960 [Kofleriaceae bacterium]|nr:hypothetical protein [Kofleriaceae bacterium]
MIGPPYLGTVGKTRTATVHVIDSRGALVAVQVYTGIDVAADPMLAEQLRDDTLNVVQLGGGEMRIAVPVVYHDPSARLLVLVLGDAHRHREIEERIRLLEELRDDIADIPGYAKDFVVVFGSAGLCALLEDRERQRDALAELAAARVELARLRGEARGDTEQFPAAAVLEIPSSSDVPLGDGEIDPDGEPVIERVLDPDDLDDLDDPLEDPDGAGEPAALDGEAAPDGAHALDGEPALDAEAAIEAEAMLDGEAALDDGVSAGHAFEDAPSGSEPFDPGFDEVPFDEPSLDEVPFDDSSFEDGFGAEIGLGEPLPLPSVLPPTGAGAAAGPGDAALDAEADADADAEVAAALEADGEAGIDAGIGAEAVLADAEASGPGALPALLVDTAESLGPGGDPVTTEVTELPLDAATAGADGEAAPAALPPGWHIDDTGVHLAIAADAGLAAVLAGPLDLRLVLHREEAAPVIALVLGSPAALRAPSPGELAVETLDVAADRDRGVLRALGRSFAFTLTVVTGGRPVRRCKLTAPLADNVGYVMQAADEHLHAVTEHGGLDPEAARALVLGAGHDLLGIEHPERSELRVEKLAQIATAQQLRRALALARRFTRPALEDYLVCTRGFPLSLWHQLRRKTVARAVAWGLWMGPELAQIAVSEGFARSRRDLIGRLERGFEKLRHDPVAFDIDAEATADNAAAIAEQARALGVALRAGAPNGAGAIASDAAPVAAGSIEISSAGVPLPPDAALPVSTDELLAVLDAPAAGRDGRARKLAAALALCDHSDPRAARPVIAAALQMSRGEAVQVLARAVKLGPPAHPALIEGLSSSKAYLRHGCALALALGRSDDATQAVIGLLRAEPTDLWHDIARAVGEIGTPALVWLVRDVGSCGPEAEERIAWAMAHVAARGGEPALSAMAAAESIVSPVARKALALLAAMTGERGAAPDAPAAERDLSVNHAFSQQFFAVLEQGAPDGGASDAQIAES